MVERFEHFFGQASDRWKPASPNSIPTDVTDYRWNWNGNWKPLAEYVPFIERKQSAENGISTNTRSDKDGDYSTKVIEFASCPERSKYFTSTGEKYYNLNGTEMLNIDPLGKHSTVIYGFKNTLPIAAAQNTPVKSLLSLNFETSEGYTSKGQRLRNELITGTAQLSADKAAHTGKQVLKVTPAAGIASIQWTFGPTISGNVEEFVFSPGKYVISTWVKANQPVSVEVKDSITSSVIASKSTQTNAPTIEGWQRVEFSFEIAANQVGMVKVSSTSMFSLDDMRIFPVNGNMKSFVYDPISLKLIATLDENNYATFYIYDEEHQLTQVKRETEKGIITVKLSKSNIGQ